MSANSAGSVLPTYYSNFPLKLHQMLEDVEKAGNTSIVSWTSDGRAFRVHKRIAFIEMIIPKYFKHTKFKSFQRQLYLYGFNRVSCGGNKDAYFHELFIRENRSLCFNICRCTQGDRTKKTTKNFLQSNSHDLSRIFASSSCSNSSLAIQRLGIDTVQDTVERMAPTSDLANAASKSKSQGPHQDFECQLIGKEGTVPSSVSSIPTLFNNDRRKQDICDEVIDMKGVTAWLCNSGVPLVEVMRLLSSPSTVDSCPHYTEYADEIINLFGSGRRQDQLE